MKIIENLIALFILALPLWFVGGLVGRWVNERVENNLQRVSGTARRT